MQKLTKTPIIIAIYQRHKKDNTPVEDRLFMIDINRIKKLIKEGKVKLIKRDWGYGYQIQTKYCLEGFKLIDFYKKKYY